MSLSCEARAPYRGSVTEDSPQPAAPLAGILLIDKPLRRTSMDVCANIRARLRRGGAPKRVKVGHAGTLDPLATGLLVVMVGRATSLCERLMAERKEYETDIDLSCFSSTDDAEGERTFVDVKAPPTREAFDRTLAAFTGVVMQKPPAYSAIKLDGRRAYDLARKGEVVEIPARPVTIHAIELLAFEWPRLSLRITCGKGTYIRSIARDLGVALGTGGMLTALRRTSSGEHHVRCAVTLDSLPHVMTQADLLPPPALA